MRPSLTLRLQRLSTSDHFADSLRVLLALGGVVAYCRGEARSDQVIPLLLGVIACALAETDDSWRNRLASLVVILPCFLFAALAVQMLFPFPVVFAAGLAIATFCLVMLGAASGRYAAISGATLILSVYTMIGVDQSNGNIGSIWREPGLLVAGAAWYGVLSLAWSALFPQQPVRQALARLFHAQGGYLVCKSRLFEPVRPMDTEPLQLALAEQNQNVIEAFNETRLALIDRIGRRRPRGDTNTALKLYFMAQDIHERASSSHYPYDALADAFFHSDVMFRCQRLVRSLSQACLERSEAIRLNRNFEGYPPARLALEDLQSSIEYLRAQPQPPRTDLLAALKALTGNVTSMQGRLDGSDQSAAPAPGEESLLQNPEPGTLAETFQRIRMQLTRSSAQFRHAVRLSLALLTGYAVLHLIHPRQGYWILLTTLFVCLPTYGASRRRMVQRVAGTVMGLVGGWALLTLFPDTNIQLLLIVASGVLFFAARRLRYTLATTAITVLVVLCFNQVGNGYDVMLPRLLDTLIGALIAAVAIHVILPDWQGRKLEHVLADTLRSDADYLRQIMRQYTSGKRDDLAYRVARRDAQNADAELSATLSDMRREPGHRSQDVENALRFLTLSHTLLGHLSTLGAHRQALGSDDKLICAGTEVVLAGLDAIATGLVDSSTHPHGNDEPDLIQALRRAAEPADDAHRLVYGQLALLLEKLAALRELTSDLEH
jgi:YccS/YhfK family integral membrane protein